MNLVAVNHWATAVATHTRNHPWAQHVCADLGSVEASPNRLVPGGHLDLLVASPECTHHSNARGGKPCSEQSRASAWHVLHWLERLEVDELLVENVREFQHWGPLGADGRPDRAKRGQTFRGWVGALESLGYTVEWREVNAADYGSATVRRRLFVRASRRGVIQWPEATHAKQAEGDKAKWKAAREVIDWSIKSQSIFNRARPLKPKTLARIEAGLRKFGGEAFIAVLRGSSEAHVNACAHGTDEPIGTVSAGGTHVALCEPFVVPMEHSNRNALRSVGEALPTITTAKGGAFGLCEPFLTKYYGSGAGARPVNEPLDTVTSKDRFALVQPQGMDIRFRMLQPHELAAAMGFAGYVFTGTKTEQVKQIGNAVAVEPAEALCGSVMDMPAR
jgi:DNA (cytosine-5)-methyltransferase 1